MISWIKKNKIEFILLLGILTIAAFLRLYRISGFMTFLGDEGRDVRIVRDLITQGNLVFIGPQTSVGNMYLGPLYYYMMAPALFLSGLNPVGPAIMVALIGIFTVCLTWFVGRNWFNKTAGLIAAILYAVSPVAIIYSRTSWNPNPMPFFALVSIWGMYQVWQNKKHFWLPFVGISVAFALQMHYLGLLLLPTIGIIWLLTLIQIKKNHESTKVFTQKSILAIVFFLFLMSPLVLFDLKHHGMNFNAFKSLISAKSGVFNLGNILSKPFNLFSFVQSSLLVGKDKPSLLVTILICVISIIYLFIKRKQPQIKIISLWILFTFLGLGFYNQPIYIHYFGLVYPAIFLLSGAILSSLTQSNKIIRISTYLILITTISFALYTSPAFDSPNNQLQRTKKTADLVIKESNGEPFNFGLISKQNYDESYRYFLENKKANLVRGEDRIVDQLFVVCEDGDSCQPEGNPDWQIAVFGPSHVVSTWNIDFLKIYKLVHTK